MGSNPTPSARRHAARACPQTPLSPDFGTGDVDVTPQESLAFAEAARLRAVPLIRKWFDPLTSGSLQARPPGCGVRPPGQDSENLAGPVAASAPGDAGRTPARRARPQG